MVEWKLAHNVGDLSLEKASNSNDEGSPKIISRIRSIGQLLVREKELNQLDVPAVESFDRSDAHRSYTPSIAVARSTLCLTKVVRPTPC